MLQQTLRREVDRQPAPPQLCNVARLIETMEQRGIDGVVALLGVNQYYLSSFSTHHSVPETDGMLPVIFSRHRPDEPILLMPEVDLARQAWQPSWIKERRAYTSAVLHPGRPIRAADMHPFMEPADLARAPWAQPGAAGFYIRAAEGVRAAIRDLGLDKGVVVFDNLSTGLAIAAGFPDMKAVPGDGLLRHVRAGKTPVEIGLLKKAARINQQALTRTVADWQRGMTWRDINFLYQVHALKLDGQPNLPDTMGTGYNPHHAFSADPEVDDHEIVEGSTVLFDAHGKHNGYCWDGGKSWAVGGQPSATARRHWDATFTAAREIEQIARPGMAICDLIDHGLATFRAKGVSDEGVLIFFHGLGLDHYDRDSRDGDKNWRIEPDMVISTHIYYPGGPGERLFLEEIVFVSDRGNERLFDWDGEMLGLA